MRRRGSGAGAARWDSLTRRLAVSQIRQNRQHAPVFGLGGVEPELVEDARHMFLDRSLSIRYLVVCKSNIQGPFEQIASIKFVAGNLLFGHRLRQIFMRGAGSSFLIPILTLSFGGGSANPNSLHRADTRS